MNLQEELQWWESHYCIWEHSSSGGTELTGDISKEWVQWEEKEKGRDGERDEGRKKVGSLFLKAVLLLLATPSALLKHRPSWVVLFNAKKNKVWISNEAQIILWVTRAVVANESLPEAGSCTSCTAAFKSFKQNRRLICRRLQVWVLLGARSITKTCANKTIYSTLSTTVNKCCSFQRSIH